MSARFAHAVQLVVDCGRRHGRVVATGIGKSGIIAQKLVATFNSTGTPALFLHPAEALHGDLGMLAKGDLVIALSSSGETEEVLRLLPRLKRVGDALISFCCVMTFDPGAGQRRGPGRERGAGGLRPRTGPHCFDHRNAGFG